MSLFQLAREGDRDALLSALSGSDSSAVRRRGAELLVDVVDADDAEAVDALIRAATTDGDPRVRGSAIDALDDLGEDPIRRLLSELTGADDEVADWAAAKRYVRALSADRPELRMAAANALGSVGDDAVVEPLAEALDDSDSRVGARAAHALGRIGSPQAVPALEERLRGNDDIVRQAAAEALGSIANDRALGALLDLLDDDVEALRRLAASALGNASSAEPVEPLAAALGDESRAVRQAAVFSIIELLSNVPTEQSHQVREAVVSELGRADDETVVDALVEILAESTQPRQRRNATWFLGRVIESDPPEMAVDALVETLDDDDTQTAQFGATSLAKIGGRSVESSLLEVIDDSDDDEARAKAAYVLGKVGGDRARERLERLTDGEESKEVRRRAFGALSKLGGHR